jgi:predicted RNA-binding protein YlxR (DUF448 family)
MNMKTKKTPQRRCVGCNIMKDKKELIRVVRSATGEVTIDKIGKNREEGLCLSGCRMREQGG